VTPCGPRLLVAGQTFEFVSFRAALPFPVFVAFVAVGVALPVRPPGSYPCCFVDRRELMKRVGLVLLALVGLLDLSYLVLISVEDNPLPPSIIGAVLGLATLISVVPAFRGQRAATIVLVASRVLSILVVSLPAYFFSDVPRWTIVQVSIAIVAGVVGLWLFLARPENRVQAATAGR
jgi:hypothetical protein